MSSEYNTSWNMIGKLILIAAMSLVVFYFLDNSELINDTFFDPKKKISRRRFEGFLIFAILKYVALISTFVFSGLSLFLVYKRNSSD